MTEADWSAVLTLETSFYDDVTWGAYGDWLEERGEERQKAEARRRQAGFEAVLRAYRINGPNVKYDVASWFQGWQTYGPAGYRVPGWLYNHLPTDMEGDDPDDADWMNYPTENDAWAALWVAYAAAEAERTARMIVDNDRLIAYALRQLRASLDEDDLDNLDARDEQARSGDPEDAEMGTNMALDAVDAQLLDLIRRHGGDD